MRQLSLTQKQKLKESYRRGIVRELYSKSLISESQFRRLMQK